mgnify:CR=1 FL=1
MTEKIRQTVNTGEADRAYVKRFEDGVNMLVILLSPHMRRTLADKAKQVEAMRQKLAGRLVADNPGKDFTAEA